MKTTLLISTRKGLITYNYSNDGKWVYKNTSFLGIPVSLAYVDQDTDTWWACLDHGHWGCKLHRSTNRGANWEEVEAPKYPENEEIKDGVPASLKYLWAFGHVNNGNGSEIIVGTEPGGLFESIDNGNSFQLNKGLWDQPSRKDQWFGGGRDYPGIHSIVIDPNNSNHRYVGISCAGVFETIDAGTTWTPRNKGLKADFLPDPNSEIGQDPHLLVACPSDINKMWQQNHCGIFRSVDGGKNWTEVSEENGPANFGFAIAVDENNGDVAWVVPGVSDETRVAVDQALCVCRTDDGGKTWRAYRNGLPQYNAYDIVFRHALALSGDYLVFGTTTGNLYCSDDRGENWSTISNNLPMVYAVAMI